VSNDELQRRYFVLGLKTLSVPLLPYTQRFAHAAEHAFSEQFHVLRDGGLADVSDGTLSLSPVGRLYVDQCSALFNSPAEAQVPHPEELHLRALEARSLETQSNNAILT